MPSWPRSRSSPRGRARRSRTPAASVKPVSSPTSTRSQACTTAATSTRRSCANARAHRYARELALVVFDIDDFKAINDRIGHLAGDSVLAAVADRLRSVVRSADIACRVGGDEFAVILPESGLSDAEQLYRRVQFAVSARPIGSFERLHLSAGLAQLRSDDDAAAIFERADEALYQAKEAGKGQFIAADGLG